MRVLIVQDDLRMAAALRRGLRWEGCVADIACDGDAARRMAQEAAYDAVVLDVTQSGPDGVDTCGRLRSEGVWAPIILLTARDASGDGVLGLDQGADHSLTKPFSLTDLLARLKALVLPAPGERPEVLCVGELRLDPAAHEVWRGSCPIVLSSREFALLKTFMRRPGQVLSQLELLEAAWDMAAEQRSNVVEVYVRYLRQKIDRPFGVRSLETVRGVGYRLRADGGA
jgi:two-component system OmpR family response regulator